MSGKYSHNLSILVNDKRVTVLGFLKVLGRDTTRRRNRSKMVSKRVPILPARRYRATRRELGVKKKVRNDFTPTTRDRRSTFVGLAGCGVDGSMSTSVPSRATYCNPLLFLQYTVCRFREQFCHPSIMKNRREPLSPVALIARDAAASLFARGTHHQRTQIVIPKLVFQQVSLS